MRLPIGVTVSLGVGLPLAHAQTTRTSLDVWTASSATKVFRSTPAPTTRPASHLYAARREHEAIQIVLRAGETGLKKVEASVDPWQGPGGKVNLPTTVYRVAYVNLPAYRRDFPDPLPPWTPTDVDPERNQPVWIDVAIPADARPGEYRSTVRLRPENHGPVDVPLELTVWGFTLPEAPHLRTAIGISEEYVIRAHGVPPDGEAARDLKVKYYEALLERRISAYSPPVPLMSAEADRYLRDPRCTAFMIPYSDDEAQLRTTVDALRKRGVLHKGYFHVVDEPVKKDQYERLKAACRRIHSVDPKLRVVGPYFRNCAFDSASDVYALLTGYINIWCYNTGFYTDYKQERQLAERRAAGDETWSYVCCWPHRPHTNLFVDMDALAHRLLFWQQRLHHCSGFMYWNATYWNPSMCKDPWVDMATVKDINANLYGDGSLFYPGSKVGVDGPVTSIRLENVREGLEDIEYLWLYEQKKGPEATEALIRRVTTSWTQFSLRPTDVERVRQTIATAVLESR